MIKRFFAAVLLICACLSLFSCQSEPKALSDTQKQNVRLWYRRSDMVAYVTCNSVEQSQDKSAPLCHVSVTGDAYGSTIGSEFVCRGNMQQGKTYIAFISDEEDEYRCICDPLEVDNNRVNIGGKWVDCSQTLNIIKELNDIVAVQNICYFYGSTEGYVNATDAIVICELRGIREGLKKNVRFNNEDSSILYERELYCSLLKARVISSIKGEHKNGDVIDIVYIPSRIENMTDADSLSVMMNIKNDSPQLLRDNVYMFFLQRSPDKKHSHYLTINPLQGWVQLKEDYCIMSPQNTAISSYLTINSLTMAISECIAQQEG